MRLKHSVMLGIWILAGAALARADDAVFRVTYAGKTRAFTAAEIAALPHEQVSAFETHQKKTHVYSGVPVRNLLALCGAPMGEKMKGPAFRLAVVARSLDRYEVVYSLAEFDAAFNNRTILLVDRQDDAVLGTGEGPVKIVVPGDTRAARWPKMVTSLEVVSVGDAPSGDMKSMEMRGMDMPAH